MRLIDEFQLNLDRKKVNLIFFIKTRRSHFHRSHSSRSHFHRSHSSRSHQIWWIEEMRFVTLNESMNLRLERSNFVREIFHISIFLIFHIWIPRPRVNPNPPSPKFRTSTFRYERIQVRAWDEREEENEANEIIKEEKSELMVRRTCLCPSRDIWWKILEKGAEMEKERREAVNNLEFSHPSTFCSI